MGTSLRADALALHTNVCARPNSSIEVLLAHSCLCEPCLLLLFFLLPPFLAFLPFDIFPFAFLKRRHQEPYHNHYNNHYKWYAKYYAKEHLSFRRSKEPREDNQKEEEERHYFHPVKDATPSWRPASCFRSLKRRSVGGLGRRIIRLPFGNRALCKSFAYRRQLYPTCVVVSPLDLATR